jgi:hypothetical protein
MLDLFLEQPILIQVMVLYVIIWGLFDGITGSLLRLKVLFQRRILRQSSLGRLLYVAWVVAFVTLILYYFNV